MKSIYLRLYHPTFEDISDRSARQILKKISKAARAAQVRTLEDLIHSLEIEHGDKRSLIDRVHNQAPLEPAYYVDTLRKGSLFIDVRIAAGLVGFFVVIAVEMGLGRSIYRKISSFLRKEHGVAFAEDFTGVLENEGLGGHIAVDDARISENSRSVRVQVDLMTEGDVTQTERKAVSPSRIQAYVDGSARRRDDEG